MWIYFTLIFLLYWICMERFYFTSYSTEKQLSGNSNSLNEEKKLSNPKTRMPPILFLITTYIVLYISLPYSFCNCSLMKNVFLNVLTIFSKEVLNKWTALIYNKQITKQHEFWKQLPREYSIFQPNVCTSYTASIKPQWMEMQWHIFQLQKWAL